MDGWNTSFLLGGPIFRGYVSFRDCSHWFFLMPPPILATKKANELQTLQRSISASLTLAGASSREMMFSVWVCLSFVSFSCGGFLYRDSRDWWFGILGILGIRVDNVWLLVWGLVVERIRIGIFLWKGLLLKGTLGIPNHQAKPTISH